MAKDFTVLSWLFIIIITIIINVCILFVLRPLYTISLEHTIIVLFWGKKIIMIFPLSKKLRKDIFKMKPQSYQAVSCVNIAAGKLISKHGNMNAIPLVEVLLPQFQRMLTNSEGNNEIQLVVQILGIRVKFIFLVNDWCRYMELKENTTLTVDGANIICFLPQCLCHQFCKSVALHCDKMCVSYKKCGIYKWNILQNVLQTLVLRHSDVQVVFQTNQCVFSFSYVYPYRGLMLQHFLLLEEIDKTVNLNITNHSHCPRLFYELIHSTFPVTNRLQNTLNNIENGLDSGEGKYVLHVLCKFDSQRFLTNLETFLTNHETFSKILIVWYAKRTLQDDYTFLLCLCNTNENGGNNSRVRRQISEDRAVSSVVTNEKDFTGIQDSEIKMKLTIKIKYIADSKHTERDTKIFLSTKESKAPQEERCDKLSDIYSMFQYNETEKENKYLQDFKMLDWVYFPQPVNCYVFPVSLSLNETFSSILEGASCSAEEIMSNYWQRVGSFSTLNVHYDVPSTILLAKAGWYYTGFDKNTKCFSCGLTYQGWRREDNPLHVHEKLSPSCPFLKSLLENKAEGEQQKEDITTGNHTNSYGVPGCTAHRPNMPLVQALDNSPQISDVFPKRIDVVHEYCSSNGTENSELPQQLPNGVKPSADVQEGSVHTYAGFISGRKICNQSEKLSHSNFELSSLEAENQPRQYHNKTCIQTGVTANNVFGSYPTSISMDYVSTNSTRDAHTKVPSYKPAANNDFEPTQKYPSKTNNRHVPKSDFQLQTSSETRSQPKHPRYASLPVRMSTFSTWPPNMRQKPRSMAIAGFYYKGYGDAVVCFWCGITIVHWEDDDDPYVEHAKWQPTCSYIITSKGEEFVALVKEEHPMPHNSQRQIESNNIAEKECHPRAAIFDTSPYSDLKDMGFSEDEIRQAVRHLVSDTGNSNPDLCHVLDKLLQSNQSNVSTPKAEHEKHRTREPVYHSPTSVSLMPDAYPSGVSEQTYRGAVNTAIGESKHDINTGKNSDQSDLMMCKICLDAVVGITFVPCGHLVSCVRCSQKLNKCPICREYIQQKIKCYVT